MKNEQNPSEPAAGDDATRRLVIGAEQQAGAGELVEASSASEAEDRGGPEYRLKDDEQATELDDALDDSFPASDPPSQTTKGRVK